MNKPLGSIRIEVRTNHWADTVILSLLAEDMGVGACGCGRGGSTLAPTQLLRQYRTPRRQPPRSLPVSLVAGPPERPHIQGHHISHAAAFGLERSTVCVDNNARI